VKYVTLSSSGRPQRTIVEPEPALALGSGSLPKSQWSGTAASTGLLAAVEGLVRWEARLRLFVLSFVSSLRAVAALDAVAALEFEVQP
jgi:hypothetical protein